MFPDQDLSHRRVEPTSEDSRKGRYSEDQGAPEDSLVKLEAKVLLVENREIDECKQFSGKHSQEYADDSGVHDNNPDDGYCQLYDQLDD